MSVLLSIHSSLYDVTFECKLALEYRELWKKAAMRILKEPEIEDKEPCCKVDLGDYQDVCGKRGARALRQLVGKPEAFIAVERVMQAIESGQWDKFNLECVREQFKWCIRQIWRYAKPKLELELQIVDVLLDDNNGGMSPECVTERLFKKGVLCGFGKVRTALGHLCKLYAVEHQHSQFSVREGLIDFEG